MPLTGKEILDKMRAEDPHDRLYITPLLPGQLDLHATSIDLHLGHDYTTFDRSRVTAVDPFLEVKVPEDTRLEPSVSPKPSTSQYHVPWGEEFVLHPRDFALGATLQYMSLPCDLCGHVLGRSTWARVGLIVAMATLVHPGYSGCLTLELQNLGSAPIILRPGLRVAQLVLEKCKKVGLDPAQVTCAIGPEPHDLLSDEDKKLLKLDLWDSQQ